MKNWKKLQFGLLASVGMSLSFGAAGCSEERSPIVQSQPYALKKSDLVGDAAKPLEWYLRNTVIDAAQSNSLAFPGLQDELKRVRFDIQEKFLVVRKSYEEVSGTDGKGADPARNDGIIVAMFPILSQFDVERGYNPQTGEENNVIVENTSDKPWYDREYIRVDWKQNLALDPAGLFYYEQFGGVKWTGTDWFDNDPTSPNSPKFDQIGKGYFDVTQKRISNTEWFYDWIPYCYIVNIFTGSDVTDCNVQESTVRVSFMKVGQRDYEAIETDSEKWAAFGTFNRDRYGYSRDYELLDRHWHRMVARHNVFKVSHEPEHAECFDGDPVASDAACTANFGQGSRCDRFGGETYGVKGTCTLPLRQREVQPVAYYVDNNFPADYWDDSVFLVKEWSDAIAEGIAFGREAECRLEAGGTRESCHAEFFDGDVPNDTNGPTAVLCHNPVQTTDHAACLGSDVQRKNADNNLTKEEKDKSKDVFSVRRGDLRYSLLGWVNNPAASGPLGYAPSAADPLTGEVVQATAYIYGAGIDTYAAMARDLVLIANGELDPADFAMGNHVTSSLGENPAASSTGDSQLQASRAPTNLERRVFEGYKTALNARANSGLSNADIASRLSNFDASNLVSSIGVAGSGGSAVSRLSQAQSNNIQANLSGAPGFGGSAEGLAITNARSAKLAGTKPEADLIGTQEWMTTTAVGNAASDSDFEGMRKASSPFGGQLSPFALQDMKHKLSSALESRGECIFSGEEFNAPHIEGLAARFKKQFANESPADRKLKILEALRKAIFRAVTEHEFGHTMTLRHNFQGSWDSMNFHPNYWKLRTNSGKSVAACSAARTGDDDSCMGPRYLDPETAEELGQGSDAHAGIEEFAYSSIMDYGYDFNTDLHGIGTYDKAAVQYIYGRVVETFPKGSKAGTALESLSSTQDDVNQRGPTSEQWWVRRDDPATGNGVQPTHYTTMARILQSEGFLYDEKRCTNPDPGFESSVIGGKVCKPIAKDHAHLSELVSGDIGDGIHGALSRTKDGRVRWPYRFGTDENSNRPHNLRFDAGADAYEGAVSLARLYEYRYILSNFRRGRRGWTPSVFGVNVWDRYFSRMHSIGWLSAQRTGLYTAMYPTQSAATNPALVSDDWGRGYVLAGSVLFEALEKSVLRPQPGVYSDTKVALNGQALPLLEVPDFAQDSDVGPTVSILDGRWIDDDVDNVKGGSFNYSKFVNRIGTYAEKPYAIAALTVMFEPYEVDLGRAQAVDGRNMLVNFRNMYPRAFDRLFAGLLANDTDVAAPYIIPGPPAGIGAKSAPVPVSYPRLWDADYSIGRTDNQKLIDPLVGYKLQVPTLIYANYFSDQDGSRTLTNSIRVWIEGGVEAPTLAASDKVFFTEVGSGVTWGARTYGTELVNGISKPIGIGHRMIDHANKLLAAVYCTQTTADGSAKYNATGQLLWQVGKEDQKCLPTAAPGATPDQIAAAATAAAAVQTNYQRYVGLLNVSRDVTVAFQQ